MLTRRNFLATLSAAIAGVAAYDVDPERLLWVPGQKTFFIPDPQLVTAQTIEDAIDQALTVIYPDGTRHDIAGRLDHYGGYDAFLRHVKAMGGEVVITRGWITHGVTHG